MEDSNFQKNFSPFTEETIPQGILSYTDLDGKSLIPLVFNLTDTSAATGLNYATFFIAPFAFQIIKFSIVFGVVPTNVPSNFWLAKATGTTAKGSGTRLHAAIACNTLIANTVANYPTTGQAFWTATPSFQKGDRLEFQVGTMTAAKDLSLSILIKPIGKGSFK